MFPACPTVDAYLPSHFNHDSGKDNFREGTFSSLTIFTIQNLQYIHIQICVVLHSESNFLHGPMLTGLGEWF